MKNYYIIDFDSTFTQVEALDELVRISLKDHPEREKIYKQIEDLTNAAMEGQLSFRESLSGRVKLLHANKDHLQALVVHLKKKVSASFLRNRDFFKQHADEVLIVSGGFKEFITPVVTPYHIKKENIYANTFTFDEAGNITGYDTTNPLSEEGGKVKLLRELQLSGNIHGIGDGYSDFQLKESGIIQKFYAYTENISRPRVTAKADHVTPSFDEFLYLNDLPRAISYPKNRIICQIIGEVPETTVQQLQKEGLALRTGDNMEGIQEIGMLLMADGTKLPDYQLEQAVKLKTIGYLGNSKQHISRDIATEMGIVLFDDPRQNPHDVEFIPRRMCDFINKGETYLSANFPQLQLPKMEGVHRLIHIHKNVPGVMAQMNKVYADNDINIVGQFLMTNAQIGVAVTDIVAGYDKELLQDLKSINNTIKFRILF